MSKGNLFQYNDSISNCRYFHYKYDTAPNYYQSIASLLLMGAFGVNFSDILSKIPSFLYMKMLENIVCKIEAILFLAQCFKVL